MWVDARTHTFGEDVHKLRYCIHTHLHIYAHEHKRMAEFLHAYTHVRMCTCIHICTHTLRTSKEGKQEGIRPAFLNRHSAYIHTYMHEFTKQITIKVQKTITRPFSWYMQVQPSFCIHAYTQSTAMHVVNTYTHTWITLMPAHSRQLCASWGILDTRTHIQTSEWWQYLPAVSGHVHDHEYFRPDVPPFFGALDAAL